ncbi:MAG: hypothetical protein M1438_04820 [Deltaproteobacteria bacterium]|nr:hypothetical protein [Deltaproteobacteria bacterium]
MWVGEPSPKERECQANLREWEAGLEFNRNFGKRNLTANLQFFCGRRSIHISLRQCLDDHEQAQGQLADGQVPENCLFCQTGTELSKRQAEVIPLLPPEQKSTAPAPKGSIDRSTKALIKKLAQPAPATCRKCGAPAYGKSGLCFEHMTGLSAVKAEGHRRRQAEYLERRRRHAEYVARQRKANQVAKINPAPETHTITEVAGGGA